MAAPQPSPDEKRATWHLDKTVSMTHLFSTGAAIVALVGLGMKMDSRLSYLESAVAMQRINDDRQDREVQDFKKTVREDYKEIDAKLQRLIERSK